MEKEVPAFGGALDMLESLARLAGCGSNRRRAPSRGQERSGGRC